MTVATSDKQLSFYNPVTAVYLSFFLTPVLGTYFHQKNWSSLGQAEKASRGKVWLFVSIAALIIYSILWNGADHAIAFWSHIGYCVIWYLLYAKDQIKYFEENFKEGYQKKSQIVKALFSAIFLFAFFGLVANLIVSAAGDIEISSVDCASSSFHAQIKSIYDDSAYAIQEHTKLISVLDAKEVYLSSDEKSKICHAKFYQSDSTDYFYVQIFSLADGQVLITFAKNLNELRIDFRENDKEMLRLTKYLMQHHDRLTYFQQQELSSLSKIYARYEAEVD